MPTCATWHPAALALAFGLAGAATPAMAEVDFSGETIEIVYNTGPGGAVALTAQLVAQHLGAFLPGEPEVIAVPMPGGALLRGIQFVNASAPDGLTLGWLAWGGSTRILDAPELQVPFHEMGILGGLATQWVTHVRTDVGGQEVTTSEAFMALESVRSGGISPNTSTDIRTAASLDILGIENVYIGGHTGGADVLAALRRGEVDLRTGTISNYLTTVVPELVDTGESIPLFYWGYPTEGGEESVAALEGLPTFYEFVEAQTGAAPEGAPYDLIRYLTLTADGLAWLFAAPPGMSDEMQMVLADAYAEMVADPAFVKSMTNVLSAAPQAVLRDEAIAIVDEVRKVSPEIVETMQEYIDRHSR
jgi:tripartite-type tricarboxylate transporter receptor subunit TctC